MKAFLASVVVALAMALVAAVVLGGVQKDADEAYATSGVRLDKESR